MKSLIQVEGALLVITLYFIYSLSVVCIWFALNDKALGHLNDSVVLKIKIKQFSKIMHTSHIQNMFRHPLVSSYFLSPQLIHVILIFFLINEK